MIARLSLLRIMGRWGFCPLLLLLFVSLTAAPATAQRYTLQEAGLDGGGGMSTAEDLVVTSSLAAQPVGTGQTERYVLYSAMPFPSIGQAAIILTHEPSGDGTATGGEDWPVTVRIETSDAPLDAVRLFYRKGNEAEATSVSMTQDSSGFQATIPGNAIGASGFTYYFTATDAEGTTVRAPRTGVYSVPVRLADEVLQTDEPLPAGSTKADYRLISIPAELDNPSPSAVLGDNIPTLSSASAYDPSKARFFEPIGTRVAEFPRTSDFDLGRTFWLIVREGVSAIDAGTGKVNPLDEPVEIELSTGWNFVGTPFTVPVPVSNLTTSSGAEVTLRAYEEGGYNTPDNPVTEMEPYTGYALFVESATTLTIQPPVPSTEKNATSEGSAHAKAFPWRLRIHGTSRTGRDADNVAAVRNGAKNGWDRWDWPEPPSLGSGLSITFDAPEGSPPDVALSADVRRPPTQGTTWPLTVHTDVAGSVRLSVDGVDQLPDRFEARLLDTETNDTWNLRRSAQARLTVLTEGTERALRLVVGTKKYVQKVLRDLDALPSAYVLRPPYPNPSTGPVAVQIGVPEEERVRVEVYNVLGQRVAILKDGQPMDAGFHTLEWDAPRLASGVYFVRMEAGSYHETEKLVRIR